MTTTSSFQHFATQIETIDLSEAFDEDATTTEANGRAAVPVRVLVCRVGCAPVVEPLLPDAHGSHLTAMQAIVGGLVQVIQLDDGIDLWCHEEGAGSPLNRVIPARARQFPSGFEDAVVIYLDDNLARPGEMGEWRIHGDFFLARATADGDVADVSDADVDHYKRIWS